MAEKVTVALLLAESTAPDEQTAKTDRMRGVAEQEAQYLAAFFNELRAEATGMPIDSVLDLTTRWWHQKLWATPTTPSK